MGPGVTVAGQAAAFPPRGFEFAKSVGRVYVRHAAYERVSLPSYFKDLDSDGSGLYCIDRLLSIVGPR